MQMKINSYLEPEAVQPVRQRVRAPRRGGVRLLRDRRRHPPRGYALTPDVQDASQERPGGDHHGLGC